MSILDELSDIIEALEMKKTVHYLHNKTKTKTFNQFSFGDTIVYQNDDEGTPIHRRAHQICRTASDGMKYCFNPRKQKLVCGIDGCEVVDMPNS